MFLKMKKEQKVPLKNGHLTFLWDRLEISDNSKLEKIFILIVFFSSSIYGLTNVLSYSSAEGAVYYYSGVIILLTWVFASPFLVIRTYKQVLYFNEIGKISLMENVGGDVKVKFTLKKGRVRFVHLGKSKRHYEELVSNFKRHKISTEIQPLLS